MLPWTHLHTWPNGNVYPCCMTPPEYPIGEQKSMSYDELFNADKLKKMRLDLLDEKKTDYCVRCHELEESGVESTRTWANSRWGHYFDQVETTTEDGTVNEVKIPFIDFRFSNLCNLKCRTCGPELSSAWAPDHEKLYNIPKGERPGLIRPERELATMLKELEPLIDDLEEVYFAGGEPLLMEEHYYILDRLIDKGKTDVQLRYNTNFTKFKYKGRSILEYWKKFKNVHIDASLDGYGPQGEYLRKGLVWSKVEQNIIDLLRECPHVRLGLAPTLSVFNAYHIVDLHNYMVDKGYIDYQDFYINLLLDPEKYRIQILTPTMKQECIDLYRKQIKKMEDAGADRCPGQENPYKYIVARYDTVISYLNKQDPYDRLINKFQYITNTLDDIRKDDFVRVFPELKALMNV